MLSPTPDVLKRYSLFGGLMDPQLERLIARIRVVPVTTGQVIVREGERGGELWCIHEGQVQVTRAGVLIATLGAGETVGEMEIIDMQPRSGTVTATTDGILLGLALRDILNLQREDLPAFTVVIMNLARDLSRRLRRMDTVAARA